MKKVAGTMFQVWSYDVWGNDKDGYTVNNRFKSEKIFVPYRVLHAGDKDLIAYLKRIKYVKSKVNSSKIDITGDDDFTLYFEYKGKPEFEFENIGPCIKITRKDGVTYENADTGEEFTDMGW